MRGQCIGHVDFYGWCFVWTRHYALGAVGYRVVRYDQVAPERVPVEMIR